MKDTQCSWHIPLLYPSPDWSGFQLPFSCNSNIKDGAFGPLEELYENKPGWRRKDRNRELGFLIPFPQWLAVFVNILNNFKIQSLFENTLT